MDLQRVRNVISISRMKHRFSVALSLVVCLVLGGLAYPLQGAEAVGESHDFTYPSGSAGAYGHSIRKYMAAHPFQPGQENYKALLEEHVRQAEANYEQKIAGTRVRVFQPNWVPKHVILSAQPGYLYVSPFQSPADFAARVGNDQDANFGNINYQLRGRPYPEENDDANVDFAARSIGGGALGTGNVQEELMMKKGTFLPWMAAVVGSQHNGTSFARRVSLKNLDKWPVVIKFPLIFDIANERAVYGGSLGSVANFNPSDYLRVRANPPDIYQICMAAKAYQAGQTYSRQDIEDMTVLATRGFYNAMLAQHTDGKPIKIHTGNWGAGAFNNSHRTMWAIQRLAIEAAYQLFAHTLSHTQQQQQQQATEVQPPRVEYFYDAYNAGGVREANEANNVVSQWVKIDTLANNIDHIFVTTQTDAAWRIRPAG